MDLPGIRKNIIFSILLILLPVLLSGIIYLFFRTTDTVIYQVYQNLFASDFLDTIRLYFQLNFMTMPKWIIYSLPGGLWVFSFANFCFLLLNAKSYFYKILFLLLGIVTSLELLQLLHITDGRFDLMDLTIYFLGAFSSLTVRRTKIKKQKCYPILKTEKPPVYILGVTICIFCASIYLADVLVAN